MSDELNLGKDSQEPEAAQQKGSGGMNKMLIIVIALVVLVGGGAGAYLFLGGDDDATKAVAEGGEVVEQEPVEEEREPIYLSLDPTFIVNFDGTTRYLQLNLQVMSFDQEVIDKVEHNMPAVRNSLILLFSSQNYDHLNSLAGKEELRLAVLDSIQKVVRLKAEQKLNDAFFTSFVMQ